MRGQSIRKSGTQLCAKAGLDSRQGGITAAFRDLAQIRTPIWTGAQSPGWAESPGQAGPTSSLKQRCVLRETS
jgi:hypothetical protein